MRVHAWDPAIVGSFYSLDNVLKRYGTVQPLVVFTVTE